MDLPLGGTDDDTGADLVRAVDPASGVLVEMRSDGVPVGLALPPGYLDAPDRVVTRSVVRAMTAANTEARALLARLADEDG